MNTSHPTWKAFSKYIRTRDCLLTTGDPAIGVCVTCGRVYPFGKLQAGHAIEGRGNSILFHEQLVNAQCTRCNIYLNGNYTIYRIKLIQKYGVEQWNKWEALKFMPCKFNDFQLKVIKDDYKKRTAALIKKQI